MSTQETRTREAICALGAKLAARGLCPGTSGNISARIDDGWLMTPTNSSLGELTPGQLSKIDLSGKHVAGDPPTKEALLHRSVYDVRPKDGAIVHLHCTHAVAVSCLDPSCHHNAETTLPPITPYFVMRVGRRMPIVRYFRPGDPAMVGYAVNTIRELVGQVPLFGICLGHQLLSRALGGTTFKLPFGHHGGNHPVRHLATGHVEITSQNHNFCVDPESLGGRVEVTHLNLNDLERRYAGARRAGLQRAVPP